jgi:hypothetical protein
MRGTGTGKHNACPRTTFTSINNTRSRWAGQDAVPSPRPCAPPGHSTDSRTSWRQVSTCGGCATVGGRDLTIGSLCNIQAFSKYPEFRHRSAPRHPPNITEERASEKPPCVAWHLSSDASLSLVRSSVLVWRQSNGVTYSFESWPNCPWLLEPHAIVPAARVIRKLTLTVSYMHRNKTWSGHRLPHVLCSFRHCATQK